jgi:Zn-dependent membrane protease YugP
MHGNKIIPVLQIFYLTFNFTFYLLLTIQLMSQEGIISVCQMTVHFEAHKRDFSLTQNAQQASYLMDTGGSLAMCTAAKAGD